MIRRAMRQAILAAVVIGCGAATAYSPTVLAQPLPSSRADLAYSYAPLVKRVSPAVVNIYTTTTARVQRRLPFPFPGMPFPPQTGERLQNSLGSGVLVKPVMKCAVAMSVEGNSAVPPLAGSVMETWREAGGAGCNLIEIEDSMVVRSAPRVGSHSSTRPIWRVS
mgnify:CR=1 FL=1